MVVYLLMEEGAMTNLFVILLCVVGVARLSFAQLSTSFVAGVAAGSISGENGSPVSGARVSLEPFDVPEPGTGRMRHEWNVVTGGTGEFQFTGVPDGKYRICVTAPGRLWLDPCHWGTRPPSVVVSKSQRSSTVTIRLRPAAVLELRVEDPGKRLSEHEGKTPGAHLMLGVVNDASMFREAIQVSRDAGGRSYELVVPLGTPAKILCQSTFFQVLTQSGIPVPKTGLIFFVTIPPGQRPNPIVFRIS